MQEVEPKPTASRPGPRTAGLARTLALVALVILNAALGVSLIAGLLPDNSANAAQVARPSEYLLIPGRPIGVNQDVLYIIDTENGWLSAAGYNQTNNSIDFITRTNLN